MVLKFLIKIMLKRKTLKTLLFFLGPIQLIILTLCLIQIAQRHSTCTLAPEEDISCHFLMPPHDALPPFQGPEAITDGVTLHNLKTEQAAQNRSCNEAAQNRSNVRNIFFHETSCRGGLTLRQACSVESAARAHPRWNIYVLFSAPVTADALSAMVIDNCSNVKFKRVHILEHVKGTPLEDLIKSGSLNRSSCKYTHAADVLRHATLYKHPGVYLDLDVMVARPLDRLGSNFAVRQDADTVSSAVLALGADEVGNSVAKHFAEEIAATFSDRKLHHGPHAVTRVLKRRCNSSHAYQMDHHRCKGFTVYGPDVSFPISSSDSRKYFVPGMLELMQHPTTYLYHLYHQHTRCFSSVKGSGFSTLARRYCPSVYYSDPGHFDSEAPGHSLTT